MHVHCIGLYNADGQNESRQRLQKRERRRGGKDERGGYRGGWFTCQSELRPYHLQKKKKTVSDSVCVSVCVSRQEKMNNKQTELHLN